jgi:hypothetical protein
VIGKDTTIVLAVFWLLASGNAFGSNFYTQGDINELPPGGDGASGLQCKSDVKGVEPYFLILPKDKRTISIISFEFDTVNWRNNFHKTTVLPKVISWWDGKFALDRTTLLLSKRPKQGFAVVQYSCILKTPKELLDNAESYRETLQSKNKI